MSRLPKVGFYKRLCRIRNFFGQHAALLIGASDRRAFQQPVTWLKQSRSRVSPHGLFLNDTSDTGDPVKRLALSAESEYTVSNITVVF